MIDYSYDGWAYLHEVAGVGRVLGFMWSGADRPHLNYDLVGAATTRGNTARLSDAGTRPNLELQLKVQLDGHCQGRTNLGNAFPDRMGRQGTRGRRPFHSDAATLTRGEL